MSEKFDPTLRAMMEDSSGQSDDEVVLMLGLSGAADDDILGELRSSGFTVRSVIGEILTGTATLGRISDIASHPAIVKVEASGPVWPEAPTDFPEG